VEYGNRFVDVEFDVVVTFVFADFLETLSSIDSISGDDVLHGAKSLVLLAVIIVFLCVALVYVDKVASRQAQEALVGKKRPNTSLKRISQAEAEADDFVSRYTDLDGMFPEVYHDDAFFQMFITEMKKSHRWISICFRFDAEYPRYLKLLFLVSVVNCMLFFNTLLFNWIKVDPHACGQFESVDDCLLEPSKLASLQSMCYWNAEMESVRNDTTTSYCFPSSPSSSGDLVMMTAAISALLSIPVVLLLEAIVVHLLCRPVLTPKQVVPTSLLNEKISEKVGVGDRNRGGAVCWGRGHRVGIETDAGLLRDVSLEIRQLVFDLQQYRLKLKSKALSDFDSRWGFTEPQIKRFLEEIDYHVSGVGKDEVVVGKHHRLAKAGDIIDAWISSFEKMQHAPRFKEMGFRRLWSDILEVRLKAAVEIAHIESLPLNDLKGDRMLLLFKNDLLQGILSEVVAKLYSHRLLSRMSDTLSRAYIQHRVPLSKGFRFIGCVLLALLNAFFLLYIFLFSLRQKASGCGDEWLKGFLVWLALEILFVSTASMVMAQIVPLGVAFKSIQEVNKLFRAAMSAAFLDGSGHVESEACRNAAGEVVRDRDQPLTVQPVVACEEPFNTSSYLFVSRRVAKAFPDLIESKVIGYFRSVVPNRPYSDYQTPMHDDRVKFRWIVLVQNMTVVIVYCLMVVVSAIPALEYYVSSVIGWLLLGFLSHLSGFTVLGVHIRFSGYFFVVFVVIFYLCMLFVGHKTFRLLHKEYYTNQKGSVLSKEELKLKVNKMKVQRAARRIGALKLNELKKLKTNAIKPELKRDKSSTIEEEQSGDIVSLSPKVLPLEHIELHTEVAHEHESRLLPKAVEHEGQRMAVDQFDDMTESEVKESLLDSKPMKYLRSRGVTIEDGEDPLSYYVLALEMMERDIRENAQLYELKALDKYDSDSDSSYNPDDASICTRDMSQQYIPEGGHTCDDVLTVSLSYLKSKGIEIDDTKEVPNFLCNIVAKQLRMVEANVELKRLLREDSSDSDNSRMDDSGQSSDDDEEDVNEHEALTAHRYLESLGLVLTDMVDVKECVDLATLLLLDGRLKVRETES
jgi:hypothetical protein